MWFDSWSDVVRVLLVGATAYVALVLVLRVTGKRTLSQLNAFDFIVTVALGSTLATILLSSDVSGLEGFVALVLLTGLQYLVAALSTRWPLFRRAVTSSPALVLRDGRMDAAALSRNRLTESQVLQAVRSTGKGDLASIAAVVVEPNGTLSVIAAADLASGTALAGVHGWTHPRD